MTTAEDFKKEIEKQSNIYAEGRIESYFKYMSSDQRVINGIFNDQKIRFTQPRALNDPLEFNPIMKFHDPQPHYTLYTFNGITLPSTELFYRIQIIEAQVNAYGILSLTKIPNSFDMWSQYADGHRGFVLELKTTFGNIHV